MSKKWASITGFEGLYEVSEQGEVRSTKTMRVIKPYAKDASSGYLKVDLSKDGVRTKHFVHRLVLESFNPTDKTDMQVNHINGNKRDNSILNLEWVTASGNIQHAINNGLINTKRLRDAHEFVDSKPVLRSDGVVFRSIAEAAEDAGCSCSTMRRRINDGKPVGGARWSLV